MWKKGRGTAEMVTACNEPTGRPAWMPPKTGTGLALFSKRHFCQSRKLDTEKRSYYSGHIDRGIVMQKMAAAQFKAQCLAVMDQVSQSGRPVVITKHGKPVVKLVPANEGEEEIFGALAGIARIKGDIENTVPASDWEVE
jgi:prevent-host-death family protein